MNYYIGLDVATTTGVAVYYPWVNEANVYEIKGDPIEQGDFIYNFFLLNHSVGGKVTPVVAMERLHNFQNAMTVRSLLERYGYIKWSIKHTWGITALEFSPEEPRAFLGVKTKLGVFNTMLDNFHGNKLTNNHTDALALALFAASQHGDFKLKNGLPRIEQGDGGKT